MSRLSVERCAAHIRIQIGATSGGDQGSGLPDGISVIELVNSAGTFLVNHHEWKWLQDASVTIGFTSGQDYVLLPADFKTIVAVDTAGLTSDFELVTLGRILKLLKNTQGSTLYYEAAISYRYPTDGGGPPVPALKIWPTPTATDANALNLFYRRGWQEMTSASDNDLLTIPEWMEDCYLEILRAIALGWSEHETGSRADRLAQVVMGPDWIGAVKRDAEVQPDYGVLANGMASGASWTGDWRDLPIPGPS